MVSAGNAAATEESSDALAEPSAVAPVGHNAPPAAADSSSVSSSSSSSDTAVINSSSNSSEALPPNALAMELSENDSAKVGFWRNISKLVWRRGSSSEDITVDVAIIGAGIAGLVCARKLCRAGLKVLVFEAGDAVGGRIRTDEVDGFLLDRGFQVQCNNCSRADMLLVLCCCSLGVHPLRL